MNYDEDCFESLEDLIAGVGGLLLPDVCEPQVLIFERQSERGIPSKASTCGCGNETRFAIPYEGEGDENCVVTACAVCDDIGMWPDFIECSD